MKFSRFEVMIQYILNSKLTRIAITVLFTLISCAYVLILTRQFYLGFNPDSVEYFDLAFSIANGDGFVDKQGNFVNHWPPFYSLIVAFISLISSSEIQQSGIYLSAICSGLIFLLFNQLQTILELQNNLIRLALNSILFLILLPKTMLSFLSEGLFIVFTLLFVRFLLQWFATESKLQLVFASIVLGLMFITRYAALGFALALGATVIHKWLKNKNYYQLVHNGLLAIIPFALKVAPWLIFSTIKAENATNRVLEFHPVGFDSLVEFGKVVVDWLVPNGYFVMYAAVIGGVASILIFIVLKFRGLHNLGGLIVLSYCIGSYLFLLIISMSFFDAATTFDHRILSPILPLGLLMLGIICRINQVIIPIGTLLLFSVIKNVPPFLKQSLGFYNQGLGYTSVWWRDSETLMNIDELNIPTDTIYLNNYYALRLYKPELIQVVKGLHKLGNNLGSNSSVVVLTTHSDVELDADSIWNRIGRQGELCKFSDGFIIKP